MVKSMMTINAFSSFETFIVLHEGTLVLGGPIPNGSNASPKLGGHPFVVIGSIIACF